MAKFCTSVFPYEMESLSQWVDRRHNILHCVTLQIEVQSCYYKQRKMCKAGHVPAATHALYVVNFSRLDRYSPNICSSHDVELDPI